MDSIDRIHTICCTTAIIDLVSGKKENVLQYLSAYLDEKIKSLKTESGIFTAEVSHNSGGSTERGLSRYVERHRKNAG